MTTIRRRRASLYAILIFTLLTPRGVSAFWPFTTDPEAEAKEKARAEAQSERRRRFDLGPKSTYRYDEKALAHDHSTGWELILAVDRAPTVQTLRIYVGGELAAEWPVSTASLSPKYNSVRRAYRPVRTPLGRYLPLRFEKKYHSFSWGEEMPFAVFFTADGVAFHAAHGRRARAALGRPASAGCVRLDAQHAAELYRLVRERREQTLIIVEDSSLPSS